MYDITTHCSFTVHVVHAFMYMYILSSLHCLISDQNRFTLCLINFKRGFFICMHTPLPTSQVYNTTLIELCARPIKHLLKPTQTLHLHNIMYMHEHKVHMLIQSHKEGMFLN